MKKDLEGLEGLRGRAALWSLVGALALFFAGILGLPSLYYIAAPFLTVGAAYNIMYVVRVRRNKQE